MSKEFKIFGIEWYDVKTKFKKIIRSIGYSWLVKQLIAYTILGYMKLVYHSSKKIFIGEENFLNMVRKKQPIICTTWHHRLMMTPFIVKRARKIDPDFNFVALSSRHGDGQFVGLVLEKFGTINVHGSSQQGRKASRGIDLASFRSIFRYLKDGRSLAITPDGPRGPSQKINSEVVNISKLSGAPLLPMICSFAKFKRLNTWDKFIIPLPFNTIIYYFEKPIAVSKNASEEEIKKLSALLEEKINLCCEKADEEITKK